MKGMGIPGENVPARTVFTSILSQTSQSEEKGEWTLGVVAAVIRRVRAQEAACRNVYLVCFSMRRGRIRAANLRW